MVLPSKMGRVKGLKPGSRVGSDVRDRTLAINVAVVVNRRCQQWSSLASAMVAVVIIIGRGCCCHQLWLAVVIGRGRCSYRRSWSLPSSVIIDIDCGRHCYRPWSSGWLAMVVVIINTVRDCGRSPLAAAVVSIIIRGEGSGRWSCGGRRRFQS